MAFITMNPGYPGRAELPESLKALFRPVSMVLPDLALICEIMLMAEGFQMSKLLSRKFVILYKLCEDLLSKARHYDWKLRAIKTTLYVAGGMKRAAPELSEDKVLLRALRDFNLGKLTSDDTGIFMGLLNDLFPKTLELVPRAMDDVFEKQCRASAKELKYQGDDMFSLKISQACACQSFASQLTMIVFLVLLMMQVAGRPTEPLTSFMVPCSYVRSWSYAGLSSFLGPQAVARLPSGRHFGTPRWS
jgi:Hydrolytic ATP binding site of dynein motor region